MRSIDDVQIGLKTRITKTVSESDVYLFAGITGDFDPKTMEARLRHFALSGADLRDCFPRQASRL